MTTDELKKTYEEHPKVFIKFSAPWCGPCQAMAPIIEEMKAENPDIYFLEFNVDDEEEMVQLFKVRSVPTILYIKDGVTVDKFVGGATKEQLQNFINQ